MVEVHHVLMQLVNTAKTIIHTATPQIQKENDDHDNDNHDLDHDHAHAHADTDTDHLQIIGPNIAAAALRRIMDVRPDLNKRNGNEADIQLARMLIPSLLQIVAREVVHGESERVDLASSLSSSSSSSSTMDTNELYTFTNLHISMRSIMKSSSDIFSTGMTHVSNANVLYSLAKIKMLQKKNGKYNDTSTLKPLVQKICDNIRRTEAKHDNDQGSFVKRVNPLLLLETLCALATFNMKNERTLLNLIGNRLKQGDATGKLNSRHLSLGLWAYASLERPHLGVLKSFTRRVRKANVRQDMNSGDISRATWAVGQSMKQLDEDDVNDDSDNFGDEEIASLRDDSVTMLYTLSGELLRPKNERDDARKKLHGLGISQVADLMSTFVIFEFDPTHAILGELGSHIRNNLLSNNNCPASDIARILWVFQRLRAPLDVETVTALVHKFVDIVQVQNVKACTPKTLNTVLRSVAMMLPDHGHNMPELHQATSMLLNDKDYILRCNEFECSNFVWSLAMAKCYDKQLLRLLSDRMRDEDIISTLTPSSASRFLWAFTSLVENNVEDLVMKEVLFEMFQALGGILLSAQLTPVDASKAMYAYAKSSYSLDMGIFDHLAEVLAVDSMLDRATVQQITEACWACGKMISWEDPLREKMIFGEVLPPPYVKSGKRFASYLVSCRDLMTPKDISMTMWAIGRLQIADPEIIYPLAKKAVEIAQREEFNSQELANILWALSKAGFDDVEAVSYLTEQIRKPMVLETTTPQEAANILYALAMMHIRDEDTFSYMNTVLMRQLDKATSQTIANALWAHENVDLEPPQQLFDRWALEKLDIVGLFLDGGVDIIVEEE